MRSPHDFVRGQPEQICPVGFDVQLGMVPRDAGGSVRSFLLGCSMPLVREKDVTCVATLPDWPTISRFTPACATVKFEVLSWDVSGPVGSLRIRF